MANYIYIYIDKHKRATQKLSKVQHTHFNGNKLDTFRSGAALDISVVVVVVFFCHGASFENSPPMMGWDMCLVHLPVDCRNISLPNRPHEYIYI